MPRSHNLVLHWIANPGPSGHEGSNPSRGVLLTMGRIKRDLDIDQHFIVDKSIIKKEISISDITSKDKIIEIGAGEGILTKELIKKSGELLAFEIDRRYKRILDPLFKDKNKIIYQNALDFSWRGYDKIISNIPYSLSEPIINKAIKEGIKYMVLIVGKTFKDILEKKETKIGVIANLFYDIKFIMEVKKDCFSPIPRVDSWMVKFEWKEKDTLLKSVLLRSGKVKNAIMYSLVERGSTKRKAREQISGLNIPQIVLERPVARLNVKEVSDLSGFLNN